MAQVRKIRSDAEAVALAALLNGDTRTRPTIVVTTPAQSGRPHIDAAQVAADLGPLADVYLIETGPHTWTFSNRMAPLTQVYGGAGRAYPVGHGWTADPKRSPLRFAYDAEEGVRATRQLVDDGFAMAAAAGLLDRPAAKRVKVAGVVRGIAAERAMVEIDTGLVTVPPQLAQPDVPIERVLAKGMVVSGWLDSATKWLDVRPSRRTPDDALAGYAVGDVVLALVGTVEADSAEVLLHPDVPVRVTRADVIADDDDLRSLLSTGEVVAVRLTDVRPGWAATFFDSGDAPLPAPALYDGGPPWLEPALEQPAIEPEPEPAVVAAPPPPVAAPVAPSPAPVPELVEEPVAPPAPAGPSPFLLDKRRPQPPSAPAPAAVPAAATPPPAVRDLSLTIDALKADNRHLGEQVVDLTARLHAVEVDHLQLLHLRETQQKRIDHQERELQRLRTQLRKAKHGRVAEPDEGPRFADREQGFRHLVERAWASRIAPGEQGARPLGDYVLGAAFLDSLDAVAGVSADKVADVVVEVLTGLAETSAGRELHRLRTGRGGDDPPVVRDDGATCWRVALQLHTPSARRLHYWRRRDGVVELSRVVLHDDMDP